MKGGVLFLALALLAVSTSWASVTEQVSTDADTTLLQSRRSLSAERKSAKPRSAKLKKIPGHQWATLASSSDGVKLFASMTNGTLCVSKDSGLTWTGCTTKRPWHTNGITLASSSDGTKLVVGTYPGRLYTSTNSGATWVARGPSASWSSVTSSSNGVKLFAASDTFLYVSSNSGVTWAPHGPKESWGTVVSSANGVKLAAGALEGYIYTSVDSGLHWAISDKVFGVWSSLASSADGSKLAAAGINGMNPGITTSSTSGAKWTLRRNPSFNGYPDGRDQQGFASIASSANGAKLVAVETELTGGNRIITSTNGGVSWVVRNPATSWTVVASSSDGVKLVGASTGHYGQYTTLGYLYTSKDSGKTWVLRF